RLLPDPAARRHDRLHPRRVLSAQPNRRDRDHRRVCGPARHHIPQNTTAISINSSGQVQAQVAGQTNPQTVGQLQLANFANEAGLDAIGNNLYLETQASGQATTGNPGSTGFGTINQGMLETSNVDIVSEITNL